MIYHLIDITEIEAKVSLAEHGDIEVCSVNGCEASTELMVMMRRPGGQVGDIEAFAACSLHRRPVEEAIAIGDAMTKFRKRGAIGDA